MKNNSHILNCVSAILAAWAIAVCLSSCERDDAPLSENQGSGRVISFTAASETEWPDITKSPINSVGDLLGDGFIVWGSWTKCPDDDSYWVGEYASGVNNAVFSTAGTEVIATDKNSDDKFIQSQDAWLYSPKKEWYKGHYTFAAAMPASELKKNNISGTHTSSVTFSDNAQASYNNKLTLNFPNNAFDLSTTQIDLMCALATQDNSLETANQVSLDFTHICSKVNVSIAAYDPAGDDRTLDINSIMVYGLLNSIPTPLEFTSTGNNVATQIAESSDRSSQEDPFYFSNKGWGVESSSQESPQGELIIKDLLVFPGTLSTANPFKLRIDYQNVNNEAKSVFVKVTSGEWLAGKTYSYTFQVDIGALE